MTICDSCKTMPATTNITAQLRIGQKMTNIRKDLCKPCMEANLVAVETAVGAFAEAMGQLKPMPVTGEK